MNRESIKETAFNSLRTVSAVVALGLGGVGVEATIAPVAFGDTTAASTCPDATMTACEGQPDGTTVIDTHKSDGSEEIVKTYPWGEKNDETDNTDGSKKVVDTNPDGSPNSCNWFRPDGTEETCEQHNEELVNLGTTNGGNTSTTGTTGNTSGNTAGNTGSTGSGDTSSYDAELRAYDQSCVNIDASLASKPHSTKKQQTYFGFTQTPLKSRKTEFVIRDSTLAEVAPTCAPVKTVRTEKARIKINGKWDTSYFDITTKNDRPHNVWSRGKYAHKCGEIIGGQIVVDSSTQFTPTGSTTSGAIKAEKVIMLTPAKVNCK